VGQIAPVSKSPAIEGKGVRDSLQKTPPLRAQINAVPRAALLAVGAQRPL
jgi:hypothetical protein